MSVAAPPAAPPPSHLSLSDLNLMAQHTGNHDQLQSSQSLHAAANPGMTFQATDASGQHFTSPFGDLHLIPPELQAAFGRHQARSDGLSTDEVMQAADMQQHQQQQQQQLHQQQEPPALANAKGKGKAKSDPADTPNKASKATPAKSALKQAEENTTPKASTAKAKGVASAAAGTPAAATGPNKAATPSASTPSKKKRPTTEVKGERDSVTGRRKIKIQFIEDDSRRHITFSKRKSGIMKKAYELSVLTGTQVLLLIVSQTGLVFTFTTPKLRPVVMETEGRELIQRCLSAPDEEDDGEDEEVSGPEGLEEGDEDFDGGEDSDDDGGDDDGEDVRSSVASPRSPSKGPIAIMRPGPTMTASGVTPKRSGGGTGDGGAAGRRSRAATISNATVRQQKSGVGSPDHALAGLSLPSTPATPNSGGAGSGSSTAAANRNRKRRRTGAETSTSMSMSMSASSSSASLMSALSFPHSQPPSNSQPPQQQHTQSQHMPFQPDCDQHQMLQPPNSAPSHLQSLPPPLYQPPPHIRQQEGQFRKDASHSNSSFLLGPGGGGDPTSTAAGPNANSEFFFSPVDFTNHQQHQQHHHPHHQQHPQFAFPGQGGERGGDAQFHQYLQQQHQHQHQQQQHHSSFGGGNFVSGSGSVSGGSGNTPSLTASPYPSGSTPSGGGPRSSSSSGFSPNLGGSANSSSSGGGPGHFPSFGQAYSGMQTQQSRPSSQHMSLPSRPDNGSSFGHTQTQTHTRNGSESASSSSMDTNAMLFSPDSSSALHGSSSGTSASGGSGGVLTPGAWSGEPLGLTASSSGGSTGVGGLGLTPNFGLHANPGGLGQTEWKWKGFAE